MSYGIIKGGILQLYPHRIILSGMHIWNPTAEQLIQAGYKEIVETAMPEDSAPEGQHYENHYEDKGDRIESVWSLVDDPELDQEVPTLESRIEQLESSNDMLTECILEISTVVYQ